jgi:osmoprotectant transport system permease protein
VRHALPLLLAFAAALPGCTRSDVVVGSKDFNEGTILGEIVAQHVETTGRSVRHEDRLGGTTVAWESLLSGEIDVYPDYTGTLREELLAHLELETDEDLAAALAERGLRMTRSLGFENSYAIGIHDDPPPASRRSFGTDDLSEVRRISDLRRFPDLRMGFASEFRDRADGWKGLRRAYNLPQTNVKGLEHDFAYRGLAEGAIDVTDVYTTDANVRAYDIRVLEDDEHFFPEYHAVLVYRADLAERHPEVVEALRQLEGTIDVDAMTGLNARVMLERQPANRVAADFLTEHFASTAVPHVAGYTERLANYTLQHLLLVSASLLAAIVIAIPIGILAARHRRLGQVLLGGVGILQTIPSLALFVVLIPIFGLGPPPAIVALFLYSLLPIVRNTHAGLVDVPRGVHESAEAIGLPSLVRLWQIELPLAARSILAGIKTAAVINVGTATLGGFIGAGGYGDPIITGLRLNRTSMMLWEGAIPAALMALAAQGLFELAERFVVPRGLRLKARE